MGCPCKNKQKVEVVKPTEEQKDDKKEVKE